jgi:hypothetical protein
VTHLTHAGWPAVSFHSGIASSSHAGWLALQSCRCLLLSEERLLEAFLASPQRLRRCFKTSRTDPRMLAGKLALLSSV